MATVMRAATWIGAALWCGAAAAATPEEIGRHEAEVEARIAAIRCPCAEGAVTFTEAERGACYWQFGHVVRDRIDPPARPGRDFAASASDHVAQLLACIRSVRAQEADYTAATADDPATRPPAAPVAPANLGYKPTRKEQDPWSDAPSALPAEKRNPEAIADGTLWDTPPAPPPPAQKPSARERKAAAAVGAAQEARRTQARAKRAERDRKVDEMVEQVKEAACGPAPERSAWNGIWRDLERDYKASSDDPGSVEFIGCTELVKKNPPPCWMTACRLREKNRFGALVVETAAFSKSARGWRLLGIK